MLKRIEEGGVGAEELVIDLVEIWGRPENNLRNTALSFLYDYQSHVIA